MSHKSTNFLIAAAMATILTGCGIGQPTNPSFPLSVSEANAAMLAMEKSPKPLVRPVVVLGGYLDPGVSPARLAGKVRALTGDDRVVSVAFFSDSDFGDTRRRVLKAVQEKFPSDNPEATVEVDVIGYSMGGLVARHCAMAPDAADTASRYARDGEKSDEPKKDQTASQASSSGDAAAGKPVNKPGDQDKDEVSKPLPKRLRIVRLFTISTPHRGAKLAELPSPMRLHRAMRHDSPFLEKLNANLKHADYELFTYVRLQDGIVGAGNAAPPGMTPWWVPNRLFQPGHFGGFADSRFIVDIIRRLRNESAWAIRPAAPLPDD